MVLQLNVERPTGRIELEAPGWSDPAVQVYLYPGPGSRQGSVLQLPEGCLDAGRYPAGPGLRATIELARFAALPEWHLELIGLGADGSPA